MNTTTSRTSQAFLRVLGAKGSTPDGYQESALRHFDRLDHELTQSGHLATAGGPLHRIRQRLRRTPRNGLRGIYLWGGVGRGKTLMMDVFFHALPDPRKRRVHFYRFMLEIHRRLHQLQNEQDPLTRVSREIAQDALVLCFDEFFVTDIGDAMVLHHLLHGLVNNGATLVFTSNTIPDQLYKGGLQRDRFLRAISLIESRTEVVHLDGSVDYRLELLDRSDVYLTPSGAAADDILRSMVTHMASTATVTDTWVSVNERQIQARAQAEGVIWFDFSVLCDGPRSKTDYVELSRSYHTLVISAIPQLYDDQDDMARRFIELVDELYDQRVKVIASAATPPEDLYLGTRLTESFSRTVSRLNAFQTADSLAAPHRP